ncbi:UDP-Glycosyltransferase/glycogen phosphorylase [Zunongwangia profunda SM-A87]|uniref:UDP-Glycosyltransferase/glycogen phosphorylase n=1 Tax=Zunongwangia profunda (strain DSM 18752 / CCTCC AB 206139 / SM-A87) TaxID=655815 RepID=D5BIJ5_ZUNPS|nr:UDP-glycosyltransferase [Zunongwangia profunda]ADF51447.1 UDP-Glycosyltransferase/glycogen phosphorylase [Zunongwangia profunda SM-A87]
MNKRILVVVENIDVNKSSGAKANVALIKNLVLCGYKVLVLHYTLKQIEIEGVECVAIKEIRSSRNFIASRFERLLRYKFKIDIHEYLEKIWGFSFTLFNDRNSIIEAIKKIDFAPDLVFTLSQGGSFRPHHALLKLSEFHNKWVAYIHDPYPRSTYPRPYDWVEPGHKRKWEFMKDISKKAAFPAFPSKLLRNWMGSYFREYLEKGIIIPHQIDNSLIDSKSPNVKGWDPLNFNILHAGNLLGARDPSKLLNAFYQYLQKHPESTSECCLYFVGGINKYRTLFEKFRSKTKKIKFIDEALPFYTVYKMQQQASVNVILEAKSEVSPFLPGKFPHCVAADKPIFSLSPYYSEVKRLLGKEYPYWTEIDNEKEIFSFIQKCHSDWKKGNNQLNRPDLKEYLSEFYLKEILDKLMLSL